MMRGASRALRSARLTLQRLLKDKRGSVLAFFVALPVVAAYAFLQRQFVAGATMGALKE